MSRFQLPRDLAFMESISQELVDNVVDTTMVLFKLIVGKTPTNLYGESLKKTYYKGVVTTGLIERGDTQVAYEGFGPDTNQTAIFKFNKFTLKATGFYPEVGDLVYHNDAYFEIDNVNEDQLIGGQTYNKYSIVCSTFMTRISNIQIEERNI